MEEEIHLYELPPPFNLQKIKNDLNLKKSLLATMKTELQKAQQIHAQSSQQYPLYDLDLGKFSEKVMQLTDRWQKIDKQIDFRCVSILAPPWPSHLLVQMPLETTVVQKQSLCLASLLSVSGFVQCPHSACRLL